VKKSILVCASLSAMALYADEKMTVSVCNPGQLPATVVARAEEQAGVGFHAIGVEVVWQECGEGAAEAEAAHRRRLRSMPWGVRTFRKKEPVSWLTHITGRFSWSPRQTVRT